jgi:hypothetical protein
MAIFNSYVKLPEGIYYDNYLPIMIFARSWPSFKRSIAWFCRRRIAGPATSPRCWSRGQASPGDRAFEMGKPGKDVENIWKYAGKMAKHLKMWGGKIGFWGLWVSCQELVYPCLSAGFTDNPASGTWARKISHLGFLPPPDPPFCSLTYQPTQGFGEPIANIGNWLVGSRPHFQSEVP